MHAEVRQRVMFSSSLAKGFSGGKIYFRRGHADSSNRHALGKGNDQAALFGVGRSARNLELIKSMYSKNTTEKLQRGVSTTK